MRDLDVLVIGSGAGGLTAALALARAGQSVLVLEQHYLPGGWCHSFNLGGYSFSPGVHYIGELGPGQRMRALYEGLGLADELTFLELNPKGYDHVRGPGIRFNFPKGREALAEAFASAFPRDAQGLRSLVDEMARLSKQTEALSTLRSPKDFLGAPRKFSSLLRHGWRPLSRLLEARLGDPKARAVFAAQSGDHGLPPGRAPAALHASVMSHYFGGGYYPKGGARALPKAMVRGLQQAGGALRVRSPVAEILVAKEHGQRRAIGVRLESGEVITAKTVISNADPGVTFGRLIDPRLLSSKLRRKLSRTRFSGSGVSLFGAIHLDPRTLGLDSGNYWLSFGEDLEAVYGPRGGRWIHADARGEDALPQGLFCTFTTLKDPSKRYGSGQAAHTFEAFAMAPLGSFDAYKNSRHDHRPPEYERLKERLEDRMLTRLETLVPGIRKALAFSALGTPLTNSHYVAATGGSFYGIEKSLGQLGPGSFPIRSEIPGLLCCGASTLGHGVAGATLSGLAAARAMLHCRSAELLTGQGSLLTLPADHPERWPLALQPPMLGAAAA